MDSSKFIFYFESSSIEPNRRVQNNCRTNTKGIGSVIREQRVLRDRMIILVGKATHRESGEKCESEWTDDHSIIKSPQVNPYEKCQE